MPTRWSYTRRAAILASAIVLAIGISAAVLTVAGDQPPSIVHGQRVDVRSDEIRWFDSHDRMIARAKLDKDPTKLVTLLTSALGLPTNSEVAAYNLHLTRSTTEWEGLRVTSIADGENSTSRIEVGARQVNGVSIVGDGRYRVGGEFPSAGASARCSMEVMNSDLASIIASFSPPRVNAVDSGDRHHSVVLWESRNHHGTIAAIDAPMLTEPC